MKKNQLTEMVIQYQNQHDNLLMKDILKQTTKLGKSFLSKSNLKVLPETIKQDILDGFNSIALTRAINRFNKNKNIQFNTVFNWEMRNYVFQSVMYKSRTRRSNNGMDSLDRVVASNQHGAEDTKTLGEVLSFYHVRVNHALDNFIRNVIKGKYQNVYPGQKEYVKNTQ